MEIIFLALGSYFGYAFADVLGTLNSRKIGGYSNSVISFLLRIIIFSLFIPFAIPGLKGLTPQLGALTLLLGPILLLGLITFNKGLKAGNSPLVVTLGSCYAAVTVLLSVIFFGEHLSEVQILSIITIIAGIIAISLDPKSLKNKRAIFNKGTGYGLITILLWGIYFAFIRIPATRIGYFWASYIGYLPTILFFIFPSEKIVKPNRKSLVSIGIYAILGTLGDFCYNIAISKGLTSVVVPVAAAYPTLFVPLSFVFFKEKVTKQQIGGILVTILGIVVLSFASV